MNRTLGLLLTVSMILGQASMVRGDNGLPDNLRRAAMDDGDQFVREEAMSSVPVSATAQPGYVRGTSAGLGLYGNGNNDYATLQFEETRAQLGLGASWAHSTGKTLFDPLLTLRYRLSPLPSSEYEQTPWHIGFIPFALSLEAGGIPGGAGIQNINARTPNTYITSTLRFNDHVYLALIDELPHGKQRVLIPEIGAGIGYTNTAFEWNYDRFQPYQDPVFHQTAFADDSGHGSKAYSTWGPYLSAGLHVFADHFVSLLLNTSYMKLGGPTSYSQPAKTVIDNGVSVTIPAYNQPLGFPTHAWNIQARLVVKLAWPTLVHTPMVPQLMPPWLMSAYSTDAISPWVAAPETQEKFNEPGKPSLGNVFFQYKNSSAKTVELIADFNDWTPERMIRDRSGMWVAVKDLPAGKFRYNYVVDGKREVLDPWNKNVDRDSRAHGSSLVKIVLPESKKGPEK